MKINERSCGSENKKDLGEDTSRGKLTKGWRSGDIVVGGVMLTQISHLQLHFQLKAASVHESRPDMLVSGPKLKVEPL